MEHILQAVIGIAIGVLSSTFGVGGAFILTPILSAMGMPIVKAIGTSLMFTVGVSAAAGTKHFCSGNCSLRTTAWVGIFTVIGVTVAFEVVSWLDGIRLADQYVGVAFIVMLFSTSLFVYIKSYSQVSDIYDPWMNVRPYVRLENNRIVSVWNLIFVGLFVGFLKGFLGVGGGFILVPMLIWIVGMNPLSAVGTSLSILFFSSLYAAGMYAYDAKIDYLAAAILVIGAYMGSVLGMKVIKKCDGTILTRYFAILLFFSAFAVLAKQMGFVQVSLYYSITITCVAAVFVLVKFRQVVEHPSCITDSTESVE